ncbi:MAG: Mut7-C RNAse domain-containing protein [Chloroflexota bacterium]
MSGADGPARLVADAMLGRLARWLRAAGYDTLYDNRLDDTALARLSREESRWLLTRDNQLAARKGLRAILVESDNLIAQLTQVLTVLPPPTGEAFGRCPACNGALEEVDWRSAEGRVPAYIWESQPEFHLCRGCGRLYWRGTHYERMRERLDLAVAGVDGGVASGDVEA